MACTTREVGTKAEANRLIILHQESCARVESLLGLPQMVFLISCLLLFQLLVGVSALGHQGLLSRCNSTGCTPQQPRQHRQPGHLWQLPRVAATADAGVARAGSAHMGRLPGGKQHAQSHRRQLQQAGSTALPDASNPAMAQWLQDSASYSQRFAKGSCFEDYPGFIAKDITGGLPNPACQCQPQSCTAPWLLLLGPSAV